MQTMMQIENQDQIINLKNESDIFQFFPISLPSHEGSCNIGAN